MESLITKGTLPEAATSGGGGGTRLARKSSADLTHASPAKMVKETVARTLSGAMAPAAMAMAAADDGDADGTSDAEAERTAEETAAALWHELGVDRVVAPLAEQVTHLQPKG